MEDFDILHETRTPLRSLVKEFKGVAFTKGLTVTLTPADNARVRSAVLSAVEIVAQSP